MNSVVHEWCDQGHHSQGAMPPISFWKLLFLVEQFWTSAVGEGKGFEFYQKIIEFGPLLYRCHDASVWFMNTQF